MAKRLSVLLGGSAVALGAFGAHGLQELLVAGNRMETWETAVFYHLAHAIVLLVLSLSSPWRALSWQFMAAGVVIFSGSLYMLCLTGLTWLGAITPIGGLLLIVGWLGMFFD